MAPSSGDADEAAAPDPLKWSDERGRKWKERIDKAEQKFKEYEPWMEAAMKNYAVSPREDPKTYPLKTRTNRAFRNVERKRAGLFYSRPDVSVSPSPLLEQMPNGSAIAASHATIMNEKLGEDGVDAEGVASRCIFDYLLCGIGWVKIFYRSYTVDTPTQKPVIDPTTQQPVIDPATNQVQTTVEVVPVPIKTECGLEYFSPKRGLIPADFDSTEFDKGPWMGMRFKMPLAEARRLFTKLPADWKPGKDRDGDDRFDHGTSDREPSVDEVTGVEIYYKSHIFRSDIVHPDHLTKLVLVDGFDDEPVIHEDDPDQTVDEKGALSPDSRIGFPYHPLVIRHMTDSSYVMSDVAVVLPQTQELDTGRQIRQRQRLINLVRAFYDAGALPETALAKILDAEQGGLIGLPSEVYNNPLGPVRPMPPLALSPDDSATDALIDNDLSQTMAVDATTAGAGATPGPETATKANITQANLGAREGKEQNSVAKWYIRLVTKFSTLVQRYFTVEDAALYIGMQQAQAWDTWRQQLPSRLAFTIEPDSSIKNDTALDRMQFQQMYTYIANDPNVNRRYILTKLLHKFHIDPSRALIPTEQMPQPKPEPPKMSLSVKGEDLSPLSPQSPILLEFLSQLGYKISQQAIQNAAVIARMKETAEHVEEANAKSDAGTETRHGGKVAQLESLDKHATEDTGGMQKTGALAPGLAGGLQTPDGVM